MEKQLILINLSLNLNISYPKLALEASTFSTSIGGRLGIKENVSGAIMGLQNTGNSIEGANANNPYAALNIASNLYGNFQSATNLLAGNAVSAGAWIQAGGSASHMERTHTSFAPSLAQFGNIEVTMGLKEDVNTSSYVPDKVGLGDIPEDVITSSGYAISANVSSAGSYSFAGQVENNGVVTGGGYSGSFGANADKLIGNSISAIYENGDQKLGVTFAQTNWDKVGDAWSSGSLNRITNKVMSEADHLLDLLAHPYGIVNELAEQLDGMLPISLTDTEEASPVLEPKINLIPVGDEENETGFLIISNTEDLKIFKSIQSKIKDKYEGLSEDLEQELISLAYQLTKKYQQHPELKQVQYASAVPFLLVPLHYSLNIYSDVSHDHPSDEDQAIFSVGNIINDLQSTQEELERTFIKLGLDLGVKIILKVVDNNRGSELELKGLNVDGEVALERRGASKKSTAATKSLSVTSEGNDESGICKVAHPYSPEDELFSTKQDWMLDKGLSDKQMQQLEGVKLYGLNPKKLKPKADMIRIDTELLGGEAAARECFKNLTGEYPPLLIIEPTHWIIISNGTRVDFRPLGKSGHSKVEINGKNSTKIHEKITFK